MMNRSASLTSLKTNSSWHGHCTACTWQYSDIAKVAGLTLIPYGVTMAGIYYWSKDPKDSKERTHFDVFENSEKPSWALLNSKVGACLDILTIAPVGTAFFLVIKHSKNELELHPAVVSFVALIAANAFSTWAFFRKRKLKQVLISSMFIGGAASLSAVLFGRVQKTAGFLMIPCCLWSLYQSAEIFYAYRKKRPSMKK